MRIQGAQIAIFAVCLLMVGCASLNTHERLAQAEIAYARTVEAAIELRDSGAMDESTAQSLTPAFVEANNLLQRAHDAIVDGDYDLADEQIRAAEMLILNLSRRVSHE